MDELLPVLQSCPLFCGMTQSVLRDYVLPAGELRSFAKDAFLFTPQDTVSWLGVVAEGKVRLLQLFSDGSASLIDALHPSAPLGADLLFTEVRRAPYHAAAASAVRLFTLPAEALLVPGALPEPERLGILRHLMSFLSLENIQKQYRLAILSQRGLRERVLTYLTMQAGRQGSASFRIPFSREELAEYLCVNRSALSHELSLMAQAGLIRFRKNRFTLLPEGERQSIWKYLG